MQNAQGTADKCRLELPHLVLPGGKHRSAEISIELSLQLGILISPLRVYKHVMRFEQGQTLLGWVLDKCSDLAIALTI